MKVITTRVANPVARDLNRIGQEEKADRAEVVRKLLDRAIKGWKIDFALKKLKNREVSISKAAEIAGVSFSDMFDLMARENIDIGYSLEDLEKDFAEAKKK